MALLASLCAGLMLSSGVGAQQPDKNQRTSEPATAANGFALEYPTLSRYTRDLTRLALSGKLETENAYSAEVDQVIKSLARSNRKAPVLIGDSALDREAIARAVAVRVAASKAPAALNGKRVLSLDIDALAKGAKTPAEFETRIQSVFAEAEKADGVILFVDQLHQYAGTHATTNASAMVKAAIEANRFRIVGGTTPEAYADYIVGDHNIAALLDSISIGDRAGNQESESTERSRVADRASQGFVGEKLSPEMRDLIRSAGPDGRVTAILQMNDLHSREVTALLKRYGVSVDTRMAELGTMKVQLPAQAIDALVASNATNFISPDVQIEASAYGHVTTTTGVDQVRNSPGLLAGLLGASAVDGSGVGIAVIDSGIDNSHLAFTTGSNRIKFSKDFTGEYRSDLDVYGHGSHVAGVAAAASYANGQTYQGVAPGASIINLKVLNASGVGSTANLLSALNWIISPADPTRAVSSSNPLNKDKYNIRVVNLSLGTPAVSTYRNDPVCRAARALVDAGLVVVAAAGNNGKDANGNKIYGQVHAPGNEPSVITVGATNTFGTNVRSDDAVASYSSRGPTRSRYVDNDGITHYDNLFKPDLVAPGNKLIYAESDAGSSGLLGTGILGTQITLNYLVTNYPQLDSGINDVNNKRLMYLSGSSMATPVVSGVAALMLQVNPKLTPNLVKMILMYTAQPLPGWNMLEQGTGEVNAEGATRLAKLVRTDLNASTQKGDPLLTGPAPNPQSTICGQTVRWSQGIILRRWYATGTGLITKYQSFYALGTVLGDKIVLDSGRVLDDGVVLGDGFVLGDGVVLGDNIFISSGVVLGDGTMFCSGFVLSDGVVLGDGVFLGDGVVLGDDVVVGDGVVLGDGTVQAMALRAMIYGDAGTPR